MYESHSYMHFHFSCRYVVGSGTQDKSAAKRVSNDSFCFVLLCKLMHLHMSFLSLSKPTTLSQTDLYGLVWFALRSFHNL